MVRHVIAMRGERDHHVPTVQDEARALQRGVWIERDLRPVTVSRRTGHRRLDFHRTTGFFGERHRIQRVQVLHEITVDFRFRDDVESIARRIDYRSSSDTHLRLNVRARGDQIGVLLTVVPPGGIRLTCE